MIGRDTKLADGLAMLRRGIAFVRLPIVLRKFLGQLHHIVVAVGFRQNARGGNRLELRIAFHDAGVGDDAPSNLPQLGEALWVIGVR